MANNKIKGITIEIGGDTTGLTDALKDVNNESKKIQSELKEVEKALKLDPGNTELVAQKMDLLADAVNSTSSKLDTLRAAQAQVEQQFANGDIGEEQYRAFQRELSNTEATLRSYQTQMQSVQSEQDRFSQNQRDLQTYLSATGQSVDDLANTLGSRLTNAIRDGSASADQLDQALNRIGRAAGASGQDLDTFRNTLRNVDNGANLDEVRQDLDWIGQAADEAEGEVKGLGGELASMVGGLAAGGGIAGAVTAAIGDADLKAVIDVTFDVPEESKSSVLDAVRGVQAYGVDAEQALEGVRRQWALNGDASDESNAKVVKHAGVISKAYADIDFQELIQEANEIGGVLEISTEEALAMTNALLKAGFDPNQLDIISEYGNQLKMAGFNALEIQAIMASGVDTKTWNIDNLLDGIKEGRIVGAEFGAEIDDATKGIIESAGLSATKFQELGKAIAGGGEEGGAAMQELAKMLASVEDDTVRNALGTKMYGTLWEEQGTKIVDTLMNMDEHMTTSAENTKLMDEAVKGIDASPMVQMQQALQDVMTALGPVLEKIAEIVTKIAEWISNNPALAATIVAVTTAIGVLVGIFAALMPAIGAIIGIWPVLVAGFSAVAAPIAGVVVVIAGLVAAGIALYQNWDVIKEKAGQLKESIATKFNELKTAAIEKFTQLKTDGVAKFEELKTSIASKVNELRTNAVAKFEELKSNVISKVTELKTNVVNRFNELKSGVVSKFEELRSGIINKANELKTNAVAKFNELKTAITTTISSAKDTAVSTFNSLKDGIVTAATNAYSSAKSKFDALKTAITTPIESAKNTVKSAVDAIKGFFNGLSLKIPDIKLPKLPKFSIDGNFSLNPPSVPKLSVKWNALGGVFTKPTIFNTANAGLQGVGEAGPEAILPLNAATLAGIGKGIAEQMGTNGMPSTIVVQSILDGRVVAESVTPFVSQNQHSATSMAALTKGVSFKK